MAVGVANPNAQGQAITSTATNRTRAALKPAPVASQAKNVRMAMTITTGTNTADIWSARA